jgi:hypothetical protein
MLLTAASHSKISTIEERDVGEERCTVALTAPGYLRILLENIWKSLKVR